MKNIVKVLWSVVFLLSPFSTIFSQNIEVGGPVFNGIDFGVADQITQEHHDQIWRTADSASKALNLKIDSTKDVQFILPVKLKDGITDYGFYTITAYVDHDATYPDNLLDYYCGDITYDLASGYNHKGTDFYCWPYSWLRMQNDEVEIVAAAPGTITYKSDGNYDQNCSMGSGTWNAVYVQHADGSVAWYGHMKMNSLTTKNVGETVSAGEFLGVMGSSGSSTGPHLHFEVYNSLSSLIDPFQGTCNNFNANSWWLNQLPYKDAGVNRLSACIHVPEMPACPGIEIPNESDFYFTSDTLFLVSWFRNLSTGDAVDITVRRPDNSIYYSTTWNSTWPFYQAAWLYYYFILGAGDPSGMWTAEVGYQGQQYYKTFYYNVSSDIQDISDNDFLFMQDENNIYLTHISEKQSIDPLNWTIIDASGRTMEAGFLGAEEKNTICISSFARGIYFLVIKSDGGNYFRKLVKK